MDFSVTIADKFQAARHICSTCVNRGCRIATTQCISPLLCLIQDARSCTSLSSSAATSQFMPHQLQFCESLPRYLFPGIDFWKHTVTAFHGSSPQADPLTVSASLFCRLAASHQNAHALLQSHDYEAQFGGNLKFHSRR